ncbi:ketopantoate reductase family protein [Rufibacter ruber]|uniref:ketopantoate reductase family protein n=1 Tax=Rufibacter ruber TaxID=1783499 RepID=UPI00082B6467|nr:2-dehydropantoate 2-reductase [Rufibacter ruber]
MKRIAIAGIGGVGGYFGGLLARHYAPSGEVEIIYIARGENEREIREHGLRIETPQEDFTVRPSLISSDASQLGGVDLLICCTKSYDLEQSLQQLAPCIGPHTVLLPLLNGVDSSDRIKAVYPQNEVWDGCVYILSRLRAPGRVTVNGNFGSLFFGATQGTPAQLKATEQLFKAAGMQATLAPDIEATIWQKFVFISSTATLTSYADADFKSIVSEAQNKELLRQLLAEITAVAAAKHISLPDTVSQEIFTRLENIPAGATSSMHSDFKAGKPTEVHSLTGYVVQLGQQLGVPTPTYAQIYEALKKR